LLYDSLKVQVKGALIKIDPVKIEFLMVHLFIAVQSAIQQTKLHHQSLGIKSDDLILNLQNFPETVLPDFRKKRQYWLSLLAKHETDSNNPYNKKLFKRIDRGTYILNPDLQIWHNGDWVPVNALVENQDITLEEIMAHSFEKQKKVWEEWNRKFEKEKQKRERWNDSPF